jgi:hypothetical protein
MAGMNLRACSSSSLMFLPQAKEVTFKSLISAITDNACVPIDPVEPKIAIDFINTPI